MLSCVLERSWMELKHNIRNGRAPATITHEQSSFGSKKISSRTLCGSVSFWFTSWFSSDTRKGFFRWYRRASRLSFDPLHFSLFALLVYVPRKKNRTSMPRLKKTWNLFAWPIHDAVARQTNGVKWIVTIAKMNFEAKNSWLNRWRDEENLKLSFEPSRWGNIFQNTNLQVLSVDLVGREETLSRLIMNDACRPLELSVGRSGNRFLSPFAKTNKLINHFFNFTRRSRRETVRNL